MIIVIYINKKLTVYFFLSVFVYLWAFLSWLFTSYVLGVGIELVNHSSTRSWTLNWSKSLRYIFRKSVLIMHQTKHVSCCLLIYEFCFLFICCRPASSLMRNGVQNSPWLLRRKTTTQSSSRKDPLIMSHLVTFLIASFSRLWLCKNCLWACLFPFCYLLF